MGTSKTEFMEQREREIEKTINSLSYLPSSKIQCADFVAKLIESVESGNENPLKLAIQMNALEKSLKTVKEAIKDHINKEAATYSTKTFDAYGAKVTVAELGVKYDFSNCNDPEWNIIAGEIEELEERLKKRETFLKTIQGKLNMVDDDGVGHTILPPIKSSTTGIKIELE